jgi:hypothetical protein
MPADQILTLLIAERDKLNRAIEVLQGPTKRIGRPAKNAATITSVTAAAPTTNRHKRGMTAASRKAQSKRMKAYWAAKKRKEAGKKS